LLLGLNKKGEKSRTCSTHGENETSTHCLCRLTSRKEPSLET
jgi:hypothetical protein